VNSGSAHEPILALLGRFSDGLLPLLQASLPDQAFVPVPAPVPPGVLPQAEILVTVLPDPDDFRLALAPHVRWIHVLGAGVDAFPLELVGERVLTCSRGASAPAIAEWVLATMLAFEKRLPESWITGRPPERTIANLGGLRGGTLGIIGLGCIGAEVARRALAFDMRVVAVRRRGGPSPIAGVSVVTTLDELLPGSDHIVVAAAATPRTYHLLGAAAFAAMKQGAHLVNVARGTLVDQDALRDALDTERVARASLDVVDPEPLPEGHWMYSHPRVRLSPHISWSSTGSFQRTLDLFVDNLHRYRAGESLRGLVDLKEGY
jgi:phosphoglycerate dehydrogenase-like enzyme